MVYFADFKCDKDIITRKQLLLYPVHSADSEVVIVLSLNLLESKILKCTIGSLHEFRNIATNKQKRLYNDIRVMN